ncbi:glutaredoxin family protein [Bacillus testis]|uniref:glutaredoxin family protein n=1 Tax=Bacillus testis TaxID=1622072 RepID=UPI00067ED9FD|nr:glutaredoxin family protein [Bacillus testis]
MSEELLLYSRENCPLCDKAKSELDAVATETGLAYTVIDIHSNDELLEMYSLMIPVVVYKGETVQYGQVDKDSVLNYLKSGI